MLSAPGEEEDSDDDEDAVAREVMLDRHKPRFGEQALAPIKVSLGFRVWGVGAGIVSPSRSYG